MVSRILALLLTVCLINIACGNAGGGAGGEGELRGLHNTELDIVNNSSKTLVYMQDKTITSVGNLDLKPTENKGNWTQCGHNSQMSCLNSKGGGHVTLTHSDNHGNNGFLLADITDPTKSSFVAILMQANRSPGGNDTYHIVPTYAGYCVVLNIENDRIGTITINDLGGEDNVKKPSNCNIKEK